MRQSILQTLLFTCSLLISLFSISQNVTINYQTWNLSNPPCDIFNTATNVPATINGSSGTVQHVTMLGDVQYNTTGKYVQLANNYVNASDIRVQNTGLLIILKLAIVIL